MKIYKQNIFILSKDAFMLNYSLIIYLQSNLISFNRLKNIYIEFFKIFKMNFIKMNIDKIMHFLFHYQEKNIQ